MVYKTKQKNYLFVEDNMSKIILKQGDCLEIIKQIKDCSLGGVITDPPYGMNFQSHRRTKEKFKEEFVKVEGEFI